VAALEAQLGERLLLRTTRMLTVTDFGLAVLEHAHHVVEDVAAAMLRCLERPRAEVFPYRPSRAFALMTVLAPAISDRIARRYGRTRVEA